MKKYKFEIPVKTKSGNTTIIRADKIKGFNEMIPKNLSEHLYSQSLKVKSGGEYEPMKHSLSIEKFNWLSNEICKKVKPLGKTMEIPVYYDGTNIFTFLKSLI